MSLPDEIERAIYVHENWKKKLLEAIKTGICDSSVEMVQADNSCSFGKWLYQRIDPVIKDSDDYTKILNLHAQFHSQAGNILDLAFNGNKEQANKLMSLDGEFLSVSKKLVKEWEKNYNE